jgi:acetyl esterase/lipase
MIQGKKLMRRLRPLLLLLTLSGFVLLPAHRSPADGTTTVTTGTALDILAAPVPAAPSGYGSSAEVIAAMTSGRVKTVNLLQVTPVSVEVKKDISYGDAGNRPLLLDLYSPKGLDQSVPGLIFIHGGGWKHGKKEDYRLYGRTFAQKGYVVASVQYRLSGEARYPAAIHDVKAAVRWMRSQGESIGVDPDHIGVAGGSAGGHLAMMLGYTSDESKFDGNSGHTGVSSRVQAVVNIYGPTDLTTEFSRQRSSGSLLQGFFGGTYDQKTSLYEQASPIRYVTPDDPPTLILHGTIDDVVPINQADLLAAKLNETGVPYIYDRLPGWPHTMDLAHPVNERCVWFMERFFDHYLEQADAAPHVLE